MRTFVILAPLLLCACVGSWPQQSYVSLTADPDATVLAPAVSACIAEIVPPMSGIVLPVMTDTVSAVLSGDLHRVGLSEKPEGIAIGYVIAPVEKGAFIRVSSPSGICSQYFYRATDTLHIGGPQMVLRND